MYYYGQWHDNAGNSGYFCTDCSDCIPANATKIDTAEDRPDWYVVVSDAGRMGFLLGPYDDVEVAENEIPRAKKLARGNDPFSCFYGYGLAAAKQGTVINTVFA